MIRRIILKITGYSILSRAEMQHVRRDALLNGKEIGMLAVLRYNRDTLSPAKFKESSIEFDFAGLDAKYPHNPLLEKPYEKAKPSPFGQAC
jgi:hypothetical protein